MVGAAVALVVVSAPATAATAVPRPRVGTGGGIRAGDQRERHFAGILAGLLLEGEAEKPGTEPDRAAEQRVAGELRDIARHVSGQTAIDRADNWDVLQRIDGVEQVMEAERAVLARLPRMGSRLHFRWERLCGRVRGGGDDVG